MWFGNYRESFAMNSLKQKCNYFVKQLFVKFEIIAFNVLEKILSSR